MQQARKSNADFAVELNARLKTFSLNCLRFCDRLPEHPVSVALRGQLIRSSTSTGANYRAAVRAKSKRDFIYKLKIVEEEMDECDYFIDLFASYFPEMKDLADPLREEAHALLKIIVKSITTLKTNLV